jgi:hypothetical protein
LRDLAENRFKVKNKGFVRSSLIKAKIDTPEPVSLVKHPKNGVHGFLRFFQKSEKWRQMAIFVKIDDFCHFCIPYYPLSWKSANLKTRKSVKNVIFGNF